MSKRIICLSLMFFSALTPLAVNADPSKNTYGVGIEGFHDKYNEPDLDVNERTDYGSVTGYYSRQLSRSQFVALDARGSHGTDHYSSPSGTLDGEPEWEYELRGRYGLTFPNWGGEMSPYIGLGVRYYLDEGKGHTTDLGLQAYDRRITQFYIPVGASLSYATNDGWSITPQAEADIMFYGNVDSRLTNVTGGDYQFLDPADNTQHFGIGLRSELMFGKTLGDYDIQVGPFVRYWYVGQSESVTYININTNQPAHDVYEPKNNRLQAGAALRVLF